MASTTVNLEATDKGSTPAAATVVEVERLTHRYGPRTALAEVAFAVERGCILGLLGPNGGGKTTLFKILATLLTPSEGSARVLGADVVRDRDRVRRHIGVVFQNPSVDDKLTVSENLRHQGWLYGLSGRELRDRAVALLTRFRLTDRANDRVGTLSGGLQRRVEIAKALLHKPRILILDEPSTGLDPGATATLSECLEDLSRNDGVTSLLTTHRLDEADRCDRIGLLDGGRLAALDSPASLKAMIGGDVLSVSTRNPASLAALATARFGVRADVVDGVVRIERPRGHEFVTGLIEAFPGEVDSVTVGRPTLADVFVHLTGHRLHGATGSGANGAAE